MSIVAQNKDLNGLSGKYIFVSMEYNSPAFIREGGRISGVSGKNHYLVFTRKEGLKNWCIQPEEFFLAKKTGGYLKICTTGKLHIAAV